MRIMIAAIALLCLLSSAEAKRGNGPPARQQCQAFTTAGGAWTVHCEPPPEARPRVCPAIKGRACFASLEHRRGGAN